MFIHFIGVKGEKSFKKMLTIYLLVPCYLVEMESIPLLDDLNHFKIKLKFKTLKNELV